MKPKNTFMKRIGILLTATLILSGCSKSTEPEEPAAESTALESTTAESATTENNTAESTTTESISTENTEADINAAKADLESSADAIPVTESEKGLFLMEEGKSYLLDMDGDGTAETIRYQSTEDEYFQYPEIYINDRLLFDDPETYGYLTEIYLTDVDKEDSYREICVYTSVDSGTVQSAVFMRYQNNALNLFENFSGRTILGGAGQYYRGEITEVRGDGTVVINIDTPVYTNMFGCYYVPITFKLEGNSFREVPQNSYSCSVEHPGYVVNSNFTALTEPNGSEAAFSAVPGDLVKFDGFCILDGVFYGRITNSAGISGWLIELENPNPGEDGAYFKEVMVWG